MPISKEEASDSRQVAIPMSPMRGTMQSPLLEKYHQAHRLAGHPANPQAVAVEWRKRF